MESLLLEVVCWDKDRFGKDYMGEFDLALEDIFKNGSVAQEVSIPKFDGSLWSDIVLLGPMVQT